MAVKPKRNPTALEPSAHPVTARPLKSLLTSQELEDAALGLEAKLWDALEWARERGLRLLKDIPPEDQA